MELVMKINSAVNSFVWGPIMLALLVGTGIYITVRTNFMQVRRFGYILKHTVGSLFQKSDKNHGNNLSPFQAVSTALAGTVGTGNIAGVTGAIFAGGPGAVFWMWISAFFGMCTKYSEIALAVKFREKDENGRYHGGPMYYITNGLGQNWHWLAILFCLFAGLACFGAGNIAQSSEVAGALSSLFGMKPLVSGILMAAIISVVTIGGVKRIGQFTSYLVPVMSIFYLLAGVAIIVLR
ncbi:MAG: alanine:cation symporter family protein, partial [Oscillospiraceae bacterium]|nr:alanine:cation symporter family protein [Oscillospiraceae bacterium]